MSDQITFGIIRDDDGGERIYADGFPDHITASADVLAVPHSDAISVEVRILCANGEALYRPMGWDRETSTIKLGRVGTYSFTPAPDGLFNGPPVVVPPGMGKAALRAAAERLAARTAKG